MSKTFEKMCKDFDVVISIFLIFLYGVLKFIPFKLIGELMGLENAEDLELIKKEYVDTLLITSFGSVLIWLYRDRLRMRRLEEMFDKFNLFLESEFIIKDRIITGTQRVFPRMDNFNWENEFKKVEKELTIVKLLVVISRDFHREIKELLKKRVNVTIIFSDPLSLAMWIRYSEEPNPYYSEYEFGKNWYNGLSELAQEANELYTKLYEELKSEHPEYLDRLDIRIFPYYPTHAFYKLDDKIYVYHYPFKVRGFHAPCFLFQNTGKDDEYNLYRFYDSCIQKIKEESIPLKEAINDINNWLSKDMFSDYKFYYFHLWYTKKVERIL